MVLKIDLELILNETEHANIADKIKKFKSDDKGSVKNKAKLKPKAKLKTTASKSRGKKRPKTPKKK